MTNTTEELLVVTGATGGLGKCVAHYFAGLALADAHLCPVYCCRNPKKGESLCQEIEGLGLPRNRFRLLLADLSNEKGVESLASQIRELALPIRFLVNNAASMFPGYGLNEDGMEWTMAMNFFSPALLSEKLIPSIMQGGRIVNVVSLTRNHASIKADFLVGNEKKFSRLGNYSQSKLALSIYTADLAQRYPSLRVNGVDPGVMNTSMLHMDKWFDPLADLLFRPFTRKPEESLPAVVAACENRDEVTGHIFTSKKHFPIESGIAGHKLKESIRKIVSEHV